MDVMMWVIRSRRACSPARQRYLGRHLPPGSPWLDMSIVARVICLKVVSSGQHHHCRSSINTIIFARKNGKMWAPHFLRSPSLRAHYHLCNLTMRLAALARLTPRLQSHIPRYRSIMTKVAVCQIRSTADPAHNLRISSNVVRDAVKAGAVVSSVPVEQAYPRHVSCPRQPTSLLRRPRSVASSPSLSRTTLTLSGCRPWRRSSAWSSPLACMMSQRKGRTMSLAVSVCSTAIS